MMGAEMDRGLSMSANEFALDAGMEREVRDGDQENVHPH